MKKIGMTNSDLDHLEMELRPGGGGGGGCIALIFIVLIPLAGLAWSFWPTPPLAVAVRVQPETQRIPGDFTLFPGRSDWAGLRFDFRSLAPRASVCSDPVTLPWGGGQVQSCGPVADPVI